MNNGSHGLWESMESGWKTCIPGILRGQRVILQNAMRTRKTSNSSYCYALCSTLCEDRLRTTQRLTKTMTLRPKSRTPHHSTPPSITHPHELPI